MDDHIPGVLLFVIAIGAACCCVLAIELYHELRRWWFFTRTRRHVEREWADWYERNGHGSRKDRL